MNGADRRRVDSIEPDQRACRHDDAAAMGACEIDEIKIVEQRADADDDHGLPSPHRWLDDAAYKVTRYASTMMSDTSAS